MTDGQRETLVQEVFRRITIDGKDFVSIRPKADYNRFTYRRQNLTLVNQGDAAQNKQGLDAY